MVQLTPEQSLDKVLKTVLVVHAAFIIGQVLFGLAAVGIKGSHQLHSNPFIYIVPLLTLSSLIADHLIFKYQVNKLSNKNSQHEKINGYQGVITGRFAILLGPSLFAIIAFMLTRNLFFLLLSGLTIFYFILLRPTKAKMESDLNLSDEA